MNDLKPDNNKLRLDQLLVKLGFVQSRERAKALIQSGKVAVNGEIVNKPAAKFRPESTIELKSKDIPWVSRAGLKLETALGVWPIDLDGMVCLDIGASTGGFTQVMLHKGAKKVYALDVGHGQLSQLLKDDKRVIGMEGRNIRDADKSWFSDSINFISADVSHISLKHVLPKIKELLEIGRDAVVLIKPQFEIGKRYIKGGVVKDLDLHQQAINQVKKFCQELGLKVLDIIDSPIKGVSGNKEYLMHIRR